MALGSVASPCKPRPDHKLSNLLLMKHNPQLPWFPTAAWLVDRLSSNPHTVFRSKIGNEIGIKRDSQWSQTKQNSNFTTTRVKPAIQHCNQQGQRDCIKPKPQHRFLLSACSHAGLVVEGLCCYASMSTIHKISAKLEHYTCMVDLLGRAGDLQQAENMIKAMPYNPNVAVWMALLGACRIHGNVEMAEHVAKQVLELEPENATGYVLLS